MKVIFLASLYFKRWMLFPKVFTCPADRTKPWGTNHAVMMGADVIKETVCGN